MTANDLVFSPRRLEENSKFLVRARAFPSNARKGPAWLESGSFLIISVALHPPDTRGSEALYLDSASPDLLVTAGGPRGIPDVPRSMTPILAVARDAPLRSALKSTFQSGLGRSGTSSPRTATFRARIRSSTCASQSARFWPLLRLSNVTSSDFPPAKRP